VSDDADILILASASKSRATILRQAGIPFEQKPANVDEARIKRDHHKLKKTPHEAAAALALAKARKVAEKSPGRLVLGADQILACDGVWFDKPADRAEARTQLYALRGRSHELITAACVVRDKRVLWEHVETATLAIRAFGSPFLDAYLEMEKNKVLSSVGAYRLEGPGAQLFERIEGDHFTILGLPLLALLRFLRFQGVLEV
jgi:septum formation protein